MSQNITTKNRFSTDEAIEIITNFNDEINEILSSSDVELGSIFTLKSKTESIIKLLFDSVLSGEYVFNSDNIKDNLLNIKKNIFDSEELENNFREKELTKRVFINDIIKLLYSLEEIINIYIDFINEFSFIRTYEDYIFSNSNYKNKSKRIDNEIYRLFLINLSLSIYDVKLDESIKYASDIEELKSFIDKDGYLHEQKEKMLKKANFLLFKWQKRSEKNNNKVAFIVDGEEKENYEAEFINYGGKWKEMVEYISNHYLDSDSNYQIKKSFQKLIGKNFEDYSCQDIHLYIKYYKDVENDLKKLDEIIEFIKSKPNNEIYSIIYKYAINNRFSLFIENCNDKNKIYEEYSKIKDDDKNYFQQYKFIKKSIEIINDFLQKDDISSEELKEIKSFVDGKIENEYKKYKANMEWSLQHSNYYIYRVSYEECMIDDIFMYSSFLLPHSNKEASLNYEIISTEYQVLKSQIEPLIKVNTLLSETKKINEDINKNKIQIIEITGIFLAVIAFVMSSVNGFQFVTDIWSAFLFMVIFATCLISFLLLIILITRRNENIKKFRDIILIFYVAMFVSICLLGCIISYNEEKKQTNTIKTDYLKISTEIKKDTIQVKPNMKKK